MKVDGMALASDVLAEVKEDLKGKRPVVRAVVVRPSPATESYLSIKESRAEEAGMSLEVVRMKDDPTEEEVIAAVTAPGADAVIVQLPIPESLDLERILGSIPLTQDADVLSAAAYARFENNEAEALIPPVAAGVFEILSRNGVDPKGKKAAVLGRGRLVGKPCAALLARLGADVTVVHSKTENRDEVLRSADIIVSGIGKAHTITPDLVKEGVVLVDAGTSGAEGGVAGDIHPDCASKASLFTPVPGGVGPVAVACLFKNTARLVLRGELA